MVVPDSLVFTQEILLQCIFHFLIQCEVFNRRVDVEAQCVEKARSVRFRCFQAHSVSDSTIVLLTILIK